LILEFIIKQLTILVGDSGVGKTSLLVQFDQGKFIPGSFSATVGIAHTVSHHLTPLLFYFFCAALLLLYDITSKTSFDNIRAWLTEIHEYAQSDVVIMLLGNKADMSGGRVIKREDGERLAREHGVIFMETSAKTGINVDLAFMTVAKELIGRSVEPPTDPKFQIHEMTETKTRETSCCGLT
uniref:RAB37, member RAS oncogene family n=1 Tax=Astyanax mexicanus TaxID=7994 RepID=A0A8B9HHJ2_ASTMX